MLDCLVIGAGPAGLTAAIYLARFHLTIEIVDAGEEARRLNPADAQPRRLSRVA